MKGTYRNPALVLIFSFLTCGIYFLYWLYVTADDLRNYLNDASINPGIDLLISIICAPYLIYWMYKYGNLLTNAQMQAGINPPEDNAILYLILSIFGLSIVSALIMQNGLNRVWEN